MNETEMTTSQVITRKFNSTALQGNFLDDPAERELQIYLPAGYFQCSTSYPVVYYLSGFASRGASMMNLIPWGETIQQQLDRLIHSGACAPMIMVLPDCFTRLGGSQYINSSGTGRYADYILELVEFIDTTFRTKAESSFRAAAGKSSGGFGALQLGMHHPDVFGLVVDHSGDKFFDACYYPDLLKIPDLLKAHDVEALVNDPYSYTRKHSGFFQLINLAAMSACYSPSPDAPLGFEWPVDPHTGVLRPDIWRQWKQHDPIDQIAAMEDNLRQLRLLYFDCGNKDEYNLHLGARLLHGKLQDAGIRHVYEEFDGTHRHTRHRIDTHLAQISSVFSQT